MKNALLIIMLASLPMLLASCNTVQGIGQDIKDGGQAMSTAINGKPKDKDF
jgi:predicted small secreted protein